MMKKEWESHLETLRGCRRCPRVFAPPVVGAVTDASILLIGQAPGPKEREVGYPFAWTAGTTLFRWFASIGVNEARFREKVYMGAVIRCFPGKLPDKQGDRKPSRLEMENCSIHHRTEMRLLRPSLVILVGKMAIETLIPHGRLDEVVGLAFAMEEEGHPYTAIPLPHPSGLSRWIQKPEGKALVAQALELIAAQPAWEDAFGRNHGGD